MQLALCGDKYPGCPVFRDAVNNFDSVPWILWISGRGVRAMFGHDVTYFRGSDLRDSACRERVITVPARLIRRTAILAGVVQGFN